MRNKWTVRDIVELIRSDAYGPDEESSTYVTICPEVEEWTHVRFDVNSCLLDFLGDIPVQSIDPYDDELRIWIETEKFNVISSEVRIRDERP